jgi:hypothetical protein
VKKPKASQKFLSMGFPPKCFLGGNFPSLVKTFLKSQNFQKKQNLKKNSTFPKIVQLSLKFENVLLLLLLLLL